MTDKSKSSSNYFYGINQYQRPAQHTNTIYANCPEAVRIRLASVALEVELVSIKRRDAAGDKPGPVCPVSACQELRLETAAAAVTGPVWGAED